MAVRDMGNPLTDRDASHALAGWVVGFILIVIGLRWLGTTPVGAAGYVVAGAYAVPRVRQYLAAEFGHDPTKRRVIVTVLVLILVAGGIGHVEAVV